MSPGETLEKRIEEELSRPSDVRTSVQSANPFKAANATGAQREQMSLVGRHSKGGVQLESVGVKPVHVAQETYAEMPVGPTR